LLTALQQLCFQHQLITKRDEEKLILNHPFLMDEGKETSVLTTAHKERWRRERGVVE